MNRLVSLVAAFSLLAGCSSQQPGPVKPIVLDRAQVIQSASLTLTATEAAVADYLGRKQIQPQYLADFMEADQTARTAIDKLNASVATEFPSVAQRVATDLQILVSSLPPGILPPGVEAGLIAFNGLVQIVAQMAPQVAEQTPVASAASTTPAAATDAPAAPAVVAPAPSTLAPLPAPPAALTYHAPAHFGAGGPITH